jgi:hypothetical protein
MIDLMLLLCLLALAASYESQAAACDGAREGSPLR